MKYSLVVLFILFSAIYSQGQVTFVKGYIVNLKGDTLKGEAKINPKKELESYNKVFFKDESGVQKNYKPEKLQAYGYEGHHFVSMDSEGEKKFFKVLSRGTINFYKLGYEGLRMNNIVFEVEYYLSHSGDKELELVKEGKFKKQMTEWMKDNTEFINTYGDEKNFNAERALEIISNYNDWKAKN